MSGFDCSTFFSVAIVIQNGSCGQKKRQLKLLGIDCSMQRVYSSLLTTLLYSVGLRRSDELLVLHCKCLLKL